MPSVLSTQIDLWLQNRITLWAWLKGAGLLLLILLALFFVLQSNKIARSAFCKNAIASIKAKIKEEHASNASLKQKIRNSGFFNFKELAENGELQYVYKNGNLIFWGDNHYLPEYIRTRGDYVEKYIEQRAGKFLVIKDTLIFRNELFEVINLVPLYFSYDINNQYVHSGSNPQLFAKEQVEINNYHLDKDLEILDSNGSYLFSVQLPSDFKQGIGWLNVLVLLSIVFFILILTANVWQWAKNTHANLRTKTRLFALFKSNESDFVLFILLVYGLLIRFLLLIFQLPHSIFHIRFFNPHYYQWNAFTPSPGDLLIHLLFVLLYFLAVKHLFRKTWLYEFSTSNKNVDKKQHT